MPQNSNAANCGDQLKHALLAELLMRCIDWPSLTYAETHAGAGIYSAAAQVPPRDHIVQLQAKLQSSDETATAGAGSAYAKLLSDWWDQSRQSLDYPGSVMQAATLLRSGRTDRVAAEIRVTEAEKDTHHRLQTATEVMGFQPRHGDFQDSIDWLTEKESLVLLIDPFTYGEDPACVNQGRIDVGTLLRLLEPCGQKQRCVVAFWCATHCEVTRQLRHETDEHIREFVLRAGGVQRVFSAGDTGQFQMKIIGLGEGMNIVRAIPEAAAWCESWLGDVIQEKCDDHGTTLLA